MLRDRYKPLLHGMFTDPTVLDNYATFCHTGPPKLWADAPNPPEEELRQRLMWARDGSGRLVSLDEAGIEFEQGKPINPFVESGNLGRHKLGKWGVNHAADPILTTYYDGSYHVLVVRRRDTGEPALPGGMVDAGESASFTVRREFSEETGVVHSEILAALHRGQVIFQGHVLDPRETRHAWIETYAVHAHIPLKLAATVALHETSDVGVVEAAFWMRVDRANMTSLYGDHKRLVHTAINIHRLFYWKSYFVDFALFWMGLSLACAATAVYFYGASFD